jgi:hypothetical protein
MVAEQRRVDAADPPGRPAARVIMARISYTAPNTTHGRHLFGSRRPRPTDTDPTVLPSPILSLSRSRSKRIQTKLASFFLPRGIPSLRRSAWATAAGRQLQGHGARPGRARLDLRPRLGRLHQPLRGAALRLHRPRPPPRGEPLGERVHDRAHHCKRAQHPSSIPPVCMMLISVCL